MGTNYYYLVTSLPVLNFGEFEQVPAAELLEKIENNLTDTDLKIVQFLRQEHDLQNIYALGENWGTLRNLGNLPRAGFQDPETELVLPDSWHTYVLSQKGERPISIDSLWLAYFEASQQFRHAFVSGWMEHELALRTAISVIRQAQQTLSPELMLSATLEKNEQPTIQEILLYRRLPNLGIAYRFEWADRLRELFEKNDPQQLALALDQIRWKFLDTLIANRHFASDVVLAYVIKLFICERWQRLTPSKGEEIIQKFLGGTSGE